MNPALDVMRLEVGGAKVPLSLVSAEKNLVRLPEEHFLRRKVEDPKALAAESEKDAPEAVRRLLTSFGRPLTVAEIKEHLTGVVPDERWSAFWAARASTAAWSGGASPPGLVDPHADAEGSVRASLQKGGAGADGPRAQAQRSGAGALMAPPPEGGEEGQRSARRSRGSSPGRSEAVAREQALRSRLDSPDVRAVLGGIKDHLAREKAFEAIRERRADWAEIFIEQISREEDARALTMLFGALGDRATDLTRKILRSPRSAPRAFVWICERMHADGKAEPASLFLALTDALRMDEFSGLRSRMKEFFEPGGFAVALVRGAGSEQEARDFLLPGCFGLESTGGPGLRGALISSRAARAGGTLHDGRADEANAKAPAAQAGRPAGQRRGDAGGQGARRPLRELRVPRGAPEARIPLGADRVAGRRAVADAHPGCLQDRRLPGAGGHAGAHAGRLRRRARFHDPRTLGLQARVRSTPTIDFAQRLLGSHPGDRVNLPEGPVEVLSIVPWR
jgi:hypothetical protein